MFKHKDRRAMNSDDFVVLPSSAAKSVKPNARNLQQLKTKTGSLVVESEEMQEKLRSLKVKMSQEKEERAQLASSRWKSGQQGPLNNTTMLINPRRTKDSILQKLSAGTVKIRVLQDEPLTAQPRPPSLTTPAPKPPRKSKLKGITCGQCEARTAGVKCVECSEDYCIGCFSKFHQKGAMKFHSSVPIQTELQTHVSAQDVFNSLQTPPNPSCYPATFSSPNPRPSSTHNHSALSDVFTDQRPADAVRAQHALIQDNSTQILIVRPEENNNLQSEPEPSLLNGIYDEEEAVKSFQDALRQWREAEPAQEQMWTPPQPPDGYSEAAGGRVFTGAARFLEECIQHRVKFFIVLRAALVPRRPVTVADVLTQADLSPGGGGEGGRVPVRVDFSEHGLTLLDRLLLKKHRRNPIELPPLMDPHGKSLPKSPVKDLEANLTAEDEEVHTYLTSLFAVPTNAERSGLDNSTPGACVSIEVLDEEDSAVDVEAKRMVNRIIPAHQTAGTKNRTSKSPSPRATERFILSGEIGEMKTSIAACSALSSKAEPTADTPGDHRTRPKPSCSPVSFRPIDSPSAGRSLTSEISPALRTTFHSEADQLNMAVLPVIGKHQAQSTGYAKESTFALIREYHNALKSIQDDEMSSDSLESSLCEQESGARARSRRRTSTGGRASRASARFDRGASGPAYQERERDLPADEAQQLSEPARMFHSQRSWSDSDDSSDDMPSPLCDIHPYLQLKRFDAVHQNRTSLESSTSTEFSEAEMRETSVVDQTGCEDPDMETDATEHIMSRLENELRMLVKESGSEVFTVAAGNSRMENPPGNGLYTRRRMSKEEEDEEEAMQNDLKTILLLP